MKQVALVWHNCRYTAAILPVIVCRASAHGVAAHIITRFVPGVFNDVGFRKGTAENTAIPLFVEKNESAKKT